MALGLSGRGDPHAAAPLIGDSVGAPFQSVWRAPLVPAALSLTLGIVLDRYLDVPLVISLVGAGCALLAWSLTLRCRQAGLALVYLSLALAASGAAYHHVQRTVVASDDFARFVHMDAMPVCVRGCLEEGPFYHPDPPPNPLRPIPGTASSVAVLGATFLKQGDTWQPVSGRLRLVVQGRLEGFVVGDEVEVFGRASAPSGPANPGEYDYAEHLRDQQIRAVVRVSKTPDAVRKLSEGPLWSVFRYLALTRGWSQRALRKDLLQHYHGLATALILGQDSTLTTADKEKYIRTAVIHALVISGQHLVVLAFVLWQVLGVLGVPRRWGSVFVALFLLAYALLTGGQPPVMRSAIMALAGCGAVLLRRPVLPANLFALAWLGVALLDPTDIFQSGCQLSFLCVLVLYWGVARLAEQEADVDPLDKLVEESRPVWQRWLRWSGKLLLWHYLVTLIIWAAVAPLAASRNHLVSPAGLLIGPPVVLFTSIALVTGFLMILTSPLSLEPLTVVLGWCTRWSLAACDGIVNLGDRMPFGHFYVSTLPEWWLWGLYLCLIALLMLPALWQYRRWAVLASGAWLCVALFGGAARPDIQELRCTFLSVGHGCCVVLETPDGRTLLYDAGSMGNEEVTRRQIAPYLWHRGVRRVDEVLLSHADLDHFNGLAALLERFTVCQVSCTPTFQDRAVPSVRFTLDRLVKWDVPLRVLKAGDQLTAGPIELEVLHPPPQGPAGNENARSLVLLVHHAGHRLLLTGDLEGPGLEQVLGGPPCRVDVLMAPHHGSPAANTPALAKWAQPSVVISTQRAPQAGARRGEPYSQTGAWFLDTGTHGAITVRSSEDRLLVETFKTGQRVDVSLFRHRGLSASDRSK